MFFSFFQKSEINMENYPESFVMIIFRLASCLKNE